MSIALHYSFRQIDPESPYDRENIPENLIEQVYLKFCDLTGFPEWLLGLQNLTHINISCNAIDQLPPTIELLANLNYLDASANKIAVLPESLCLLTKLCYLDVSRNLIENIPAGDTRENARKCGSRLKHIFFFAAVANLENLEFLNFDGNLITEVPNELAKCANIFHLSFDDCSRLCRVPNTLLMMPNLVNASFRGCSLAVVPSRISEKIENLIFTGNRLLNCIPYDAKGFLDPDMTLAEFYWMSDNELAAFTVAQPKFIETCQWIKHFKLSNGVIANIPWSLERIFTLQSKNVNSLKELCMRMVTQDESQDLPRPISDALNQPTGSCFCGVFIFTEAFTAFFFEKQQKQLPLLYNRFFCSHKCLKLFHDTTQDDFTFLS